MRIAFDVAQSLVAVARRRRLSLVGHGATAVPPRWWPRSLYYGWALVVVLGSTAIASYGVLLYAFSVFVLPMQASLGWSTATVTAGMSVAQLVAGAAAIPVGRWVDRHGARLLMPAGAVLATVVLVGWSRVASTVAWWALMAGMGVAMAAVQYEPAFAVIATWFRRGRARALSLLTLTGAFASLAGVPLAAVLVQRHGWRSALLHLAVIFGGLTILPLAVVLRRHPRDVGSAPDGAASGGDPPLCDLETARARGLPAPVLSSSVTCQAHCDDVSARRVRCGAPYRWIALAMTLSAFVSMAVVVHLVPLLQARALSNAVAASAVAVLGVTAIPGRLLFAPMEARWSTRQVAAAFLALQAVAAAWLLLGTGRAPAWGFVLLFGAAAGALTPARAALLADLAPAELFGRINGPLAFRISLARAAGPMGGSLLMSLAPGGGRDAIFLSTVLALSLAAAAAILAAGDRRPVSVPPVSMPRA